MYLIPWNNHCKIYLQYCFHVILVPVNFVLGYQDIPTVSSYQSYLFGMLDKHSAQMLANEFKIHVKKREKFLLTKHTSYWLRWQIDYLPIDRNMFYAADDHNQEYDMDNEMYEYHPNIQDNLNVIYFPHTVNKYNFKMKIEIILIGILYFYVIYKHTRWPFVFSCNGKHILHTSQWKKLFLPPIRQIPHPLQWYWSLSSSSNRLQIRHVYWKHVNIKILFFFRQIKYKLIDLYNIYEMMITFPKRTPQFWHSACTFCRVSHRVQINSVNVFLSKWWSSFSSWQYRQL